LQHIKGLKSNVEMHSSGNVPKRIFDIDDATHGGAPEEKAESLLKRIASRLKIDPDLSQLKFDRVKEGIMGCHVLYQQYHNGVPISDAWVRVDIDHDGKIYNVRNDLVPAPLIKKIPREKARGVPLLSAEEAYEFAKNSLDGSGSKEEAVVSGQELVYFRRDEIPVLAWKIVTGTENPPAGWKIYVDAATGAIIDRFDMHRKADGKGRVFDPNPVVTLDDITLKKDSMIPEAAYHDVVLPGLSDSGFLEGPFVSTRRTIGCAHNPELEFLFPRSNVNFLEVMAYFHIDRFQRYLQGLGFDKVLNRRIEVNVRGTGADSSYYDVADKSLVFGLGGTFDAEDAEIIIHEYGHAIQDDQVPGFGQSEDSRAMGEGFGDFLAASFFADSKPERLKLTFASWDGITQTHGTKPPGLRRLDSVKRIPFNLVHLPHDDGEIWSASLWQLRITLGREIAERLAIAHHDFLTRSASFSDAGNALIQADKKLYNGANEAVIRGILEHRGIISQP
jgi:Zn-dependent metalloprotease